MRIKRRSIEVRQWCDPRRGCEFPMIEVSTHPRATDHLIAISTVDVWDQSKDGLLNSVRIAGSCPMSHADALEIAFDIASRRGIRVVYAQNTFGAERVENEAERMETA